MIQYLVLLPKWQSFSSDELKCLYFNKLTLIPRQNFWCLETDKLEVKDKNCSPQYLSPGLFLNLLYAEVPNINIFIVYKICV